MIKMDKTNYQIYLNHCAIEKYRKRQYGCKAIAGVSSFCVLCIIIAPDVIKNGVSISSIVLWIINLLFVVAAFIFDSKFAKKIKEYEIKNYDLEKDDWETKIKVAKIKKEKLDNNIINKRIIEPSQEIVYPFRYYMIVAFLIIIFGLWMFAINYNI